MIRRSVLSLAIGIECPRTLNEYLSEIMANFPGLNTDVALDLIFSIGGSPPAWSLHTPDETQERLTASRLVAEIQRILAIHLVRAKHFALLHAAALESRGEAILIAGVSGSGKSTFSAALVQAGFGFLSDEFSPVYRNSLLLSPYPQPLKLRESSLALLGSLSPGLSVVGDPFESTQERIYHVQPEKTQVRNQGEWKIRAIVFPRFSKNQSSCLTRMKPGLATFALLPLVLNSHVLKDAGFQTVVDLILSSSCFELVIHDFDHSLRLLKEIG